MTTGLTVSITDELVAELEALASKATGGEWEYHMGLIRTMPDSDGYVPIAVAPNAPKNWRGQRDANMQYIAAANPDVLRVLLAERAELLRDAKNYRTLRDGEGWPAVFNSSDAPEPLRGTDLDAAMQSEAAK